jgi:hypothetical protein
MITLGGSVQGSWGSNPHGRPKENQMKEHKILTNPSDDCLDELSTRGWEVSHMAAAAIGDYKITILLTRQKPTKPIVRGPR